MTKMSFQMDFQLNVLVKTFSTMTAGDCYSFDFLGEKFAPVSLVVQLMANLYMSFDTLDIH